MMYFWRWLAQLPSQSSSVVAWTVKSAHWLRHLFTTAYSPVQWPRKEAPTPRTVRRLHRLKRRPMDFPRSKTSERESTKGSLQHQTKAWHRPSSKSSKARNSSQPAANLMQNTRFQSKERILVTMNTSIRKIGRRDRRKRSFRQVHWVGQSQMSH